MRTPSRALIFISLLLGAFAASGSLQGCKKKLGPSPFLDQSLKSQDLNPAKHRVIKTGAVGESSGLTLVWIPIKRPSETDAKLNMLARLQEEGISLEEKTVIFANASRERGGFSLLGFVAAPSIVLTADIVEVVGSAGQNTAAAKPLRTDEVDNVPLSKRAQRKNHHAVIIGIERYRQNVSNADFAAHDAEVMKKYLTNKLGYPEENIALLLNQQAAKSDLEKYLEHWLQDRVEKDGTVFIYYSGHGAPNTKTSEGHLLPYDGDPTFLDSTGYPLKRLYEHLGKLPARQVIVVIDSCFSGSGGRSVTAKGLRPLVLMRDTPVPTTGKMVVLTASAGTQVSSTFDAKQHGLLTYFFLKGLQGSADQNNDGKINLNEIYAYVKPQVEGVARREFHNEQTPQLFGSSKLLSEGINLVGD